MNLLIAFFGFLSIVVAASAVLEQEDNYVDEIVVGATESAKFSSLNEKILIMIGQYLDCPQKSLGFVNKALFEIFFKKHPYQVFLAERFAFPEFKNLQNVSVVSFLGKMSYMKDPVQLYNSLEKRLDASGEFFGSDAIIVAHYAGNLQNSLDWYLKPKYSDYKEEFALNLAQIGAFDQLIEYMVENPIAARNIVISVEINVGKRLMQRIMNLDASLCRAVFGDGCSDDLASECARLYKQLLDSLKYPIEKVYYIVISIVANVPEELFLDEVFNLIDDSYRSELFRLIFMEFAFYESSRDNYRIFETMKRIMEGVSLEDERYDAFCWLLNRLRFGIDVHYIDFIAAYDYTQYGIGSYMFQSVLAASLTRRIDDVVYRTYLETKNDYRMDIISLALNRNLVGGIYVLSNLLTSAEGSIRQSIMNHTGVFRRMLDAYDIISFNYVAEKGEYHFFIQLKPSLIAKDEKVLAVSFDYVFDNKFQADRFYYFEKFIAKTIRKKCFTSSYHTKETLQAALNSIRDFNENTEIEISFIDSFIASYEVLKIISEDEEIRRQVIDLEMQFEPLDGKTWSKLLNAPIHNLKGISDDIVRVAEIFKHLITYSQIRHLEEFLEKNVASIFMYRLTIYLEQHAEDSYYWYRLVLRYWLQGPHRDRLIELREEFADYLEKLALEVDEEDSRFIRAILK